MCRDQVNNALAVLMQRKLVVYMVKVVEKQNEGSMSYCQLVKLYEHQLQRLAYNFTFGPFGGVYGNDGYGGRFYSCRKGFILCAVI
jgi:hypothetical protein